MALYGGSRDISLFRHINRELMQDIISQQVVLYKCNITETVTNIYGEATTGRIFQEPLLLYALVDRQDQTAPIAEGLVGFQWPINFRFYRDDLVDANVVPEIGDFIMWNEGYWEIDNTNYNQLVVGKDPNYPYTDSTNSNPLETDLADFGQNVSVICLAHYVPADRVGIVQQRL